MPYLSYDFIFFEFPFSAASDVVMQCGVERTNSHDALHPVHPYLIVDATPAVYIVQSRHERQVTHDTGILTAFPSTHFPSAATIITRFVLATLLYASDEAGRNWAFETPGCATQQPDAVYQIGWKDSGRTREMSFTKYFGPLPVVISCFV
jgi:hypothetical protein